MTMTGITRRRFISISASAAAMSAVPWRSHAAADLSRWRGTAMGADASITLAVADRARGDALIEMARAEIERLEAIFSLYRPSSAISRLNRAGVLANPPFDMLALLAEADRVHALTAGAFDPTVQPVWSAFADHFSEPLPLGSAPDKITMKAARSRLGWGDLEFAPALVRFAKPSMAITLNGIAQGYVTDRVADLLRAEGLKNVLVELGELRAVGPRPDGTPWRIGLDGAERGGANAGSIDLADKAVATSAPLGTTFDAKHEIGHIIDPVTGLPGGRWRQVSVIAPAATLADGLSTAFCLMPRDAISGVLSAVPDLSVRLVDEAGLVVALQG